MSIEIADNFTYRGKKHNFDRNVVNTIEELQQLSSDEIPDEGFVVYCLEDAQFYKFSADKKQTISNSEFINGNGGYWEPLHFLNTTEITESSEIQDNYLYKGATSSGKQYVEDSVTFYDTLYVQTPRSAPKFYVTDDIIGAYKPIETNGVGLTINGGALTINGGGNVNAVNSNIVAKSLKYISYSSVSDEESPILLANGGVLARSEVAKIIIDDFLSSTSTNPVQNKVINTALAAKANLGHTHRYAGSSSESGSATSADKLNHDAGCERTPVYFKNGIPVACDFNIPEDADFNNTDTTYTGGTGISIDKDNKISNTGIISITNNTERDSEYWEWEVTTGEGQMSYIQVPKYKGGTGIEINDTTISCSVTNTDTKNTVGTYTYQGNMYLVGVEKQDYKANSYAVSCCNTKVYCTSNGNLCVPGLIIEDNENSNYPAKLFLYYDEDVQATISLTSGSNDTVYISNNTCINGGLTCTAAYATSDVRLKENIQDIDEDKEKIDNVDFKQFNLIEDENKTKRYGVIAQDLEEAGLGNLVNTDKTTGYKSVNYEAFLSLKVAALEDKLEKALKVIEELKNK